MSANKSLKFVFCVQGEGRGHMTQAIAMQKLLVKHGHRVEAVIVGKSDRREIPNYFFEQIKAEVIPILSPNFVTDKDNKSIHVTKTIIHNFLKFATYKKSVVTIKNTIEKIKPDYVINFYEFLCGYYFGTCKSSAIHICIGHQYMLTHPKFVFPDNIGKRDKFWYMLNTTITSLKAEKKLALSFQKFENILEKKLYVVPPLLREEVLGLEPVKDNFILMYVVNAGFSNDIIAWHKNNNQHKIILFCDRKDIEDGTIFHDTLIVHRLSDKLFLEKMRTCKAYSSTAGFESICEAMYLGKPVMMVPPQGHFEQQCNAFDAVLAGAGMQSKYFDLDTFINFIEKHKTDEKLEIFKNWVNSAEKEILQHFN